MSTIKFNDGVEFDLGGELRTEKRFDGWYVVGAGSLIPVKDKADGNRIIDELSVSE